MRKRCQELVFPLIGLGESGGSIIHTLFELTVQRFGLVLGSLEILDEVLVVESQFER